MSIQKLLNKQPPLFCLKNEDEENICLKDFKGNWILLYFYPKDNTPGCTTEACEIRNEWDNFEKQNAVVLGISADSSESHKKFNEKHSLPFSLLSDTDKTVLKQYKSYGTKKMFGKEYQGIFRNSFLISPDFKIVKIYEKVKTKKHAVEVLADISSFE